MNLSTTCLWIRSLLTWGKIWDMWTPPCAPSKKSTIASSLWFTASALWTTTAQSSTSSLPSASLISAPMLFSTAPTSISGTVAERDLRYPCARIPGSSNQTRSWVISLLTSLRLLGCLQMVGNRVGRERDRGGDRWMGREGTQSFWHSLRCGSGDVQVQGSADGEAPGSQDIGRVSTSVRACCISRTGGGSGCYIGEMAGLRQEWHPQLRPRGCKLWTPALLAWTRVGDHQLDDHWWLACLWVWGSCVPCWGWHLRTPGLAWDQWVL